MTDVGDIRQDEWGSHFGAVLACLAVTSGPVLELGVGHCSTPLLHAFCMASKRHLVSVEQNEDWFELFRSKYEEEGHEFIKGEYSDEVPKLWASRSVTLIDNSPGGERRRDDFIMLLPLSEFVIVHDFHKENQEMIEPLLNGLNSYICNAYQPPTLVASVSRKIPHSIIERT